MIHSQIKFETNRKIFHLCALILPTFYIFISQKFMCIALAIITIITFYLDVSRHYNPKIKWIIAKFFSHLLRKKENNEGSLSGASYMSLGFFLTCLFFPKELSIISWLILIISDCVAAIVGTRFGTALSNGKSLAGSSAFFVSAFFISIICCFALGYKTSLFIIVTSCILTTATEFFSAQLKINDNLSIPLTYAAAYSLLGLMV